MGLASMIYNGITRKTSTLFVTIAVGGLFFERALDTTAETIFREVNKGKLWADIKHKYEVEEPEE